MSSAFVLAPLVALATGGGTSAWASAFLLTLAVELPLLALVFCDDAHTPRRLLVGALANVITHPLVWLAVQRLLPPGLFTFVGAELFAVAVEAALFAWLLRAPRLKAFGASLLGNGASVMAGVALALAG